MTTRGLISILLAGGAVTIAGCSGDSKVEVNINNGQTRLHIIANQGPHTPTGPLTLEEKKKLVKALRKNPDRIRTITNRERAWLAGATLKD